MTALKEDARIERDAAGQPPGEPLVLAAEGVTVGGTPPGKLPGVEIVAYSGGLMRVPGWGDVVIDLAGLDASGGVAILSDHDSSRRGVVGHGSAQVRDNLLIVTGSISATGQAARFCSRSDAPSATHLAGIARKIPVRLLTFCQR